MLSSIDILIIVLYAILSLAIGLWYSKKSSKDLNEYFLGGRKLPWYLAGISMVATTFAADTPLAVTELVAESGISGNWLWWNMLIGGMMTTFFFARYWRRANVLTELEFIELRYSGKPAAFLRGFRAVYLGLFMNILILGWVNVAMITILEVFFGLTGAHVYYYLGGAMLLAAVYSSLGGLKGVVVTDVVQFVLAMAGCIILAVLVVNDEQVGGIDGLVEKLPKGSLNFLPTIGNDESETGGMLTLGIASFLAFAGFQWWASWYPGAEPGGGGYVAQRMMSAKNEKEALRATLFFQFAHYCLRPWPWLIVALCCIVLYPDVYPRERYICAMVEYLPSGLRGLMLVAFFAAYMSTLSTQLNWGASFVTNDLFKRFIFKSNDDENEDLKNRKLVKVARLSTVFLMILSAVVTIWMDSVSGVWKFLIECGAGLGMVLILRWYWWRINAWSEIIATIVPFLAYGISHFVLNLEFPWSFFFTVGITTISWLVATFLTEPVETKHLSKFYEKIKPMGFWKKRRNINEKKEFIMLIVCWLSGVCAAYSALFLLGNLLFGLTEYRVVLCSSLIISVLLLYIGMKKISYNHE